MPPPFRARATTVTPSRYPGSATRHLPIAGSRPGTLQRLASETPHKRLDERTLTERPDERKKGVLRIKIQLNRSGTFTTPMDLVDGVDGVELDNAIYQESGQWIESLTISGGTESAVRKALRSVPEMELFELQPVSTASETHHLVGFVHEAEPFALTVLSRNDAVPHRLFAVNDHLTAIAVVRDWDHLKSLATELEERFESFELIGTSPTEHRGHPIGLDSVKHVLREKLTDDRLQLLETAYRMGYFDVPQRTTSEEIATALEISQPTFSERLRRTQDRVFGIIFGDVGH